MGWNDSANYQKKMKQNKIVHRFLGYCRIGVSTCSGMIRSVYQPSRFGIKRGYRQHSAIVPYDDRGMEDRFQKEVYQKANALMEQYHWRSVIDVGCGSGYKLMHYLGAYDTLGIDIDPAISRAKSDYPNAHWLHAEEYSADLHAADLVLCADVIEHVEHPDEFLQSLFAVPQWKCVMISTPERNSKRGRFHYGPPPNHGHWREWSQNELFRFVSKYHKIYSHEIINPQQATQLIICMNIDKV
jgi:SAM-dependent methyltransferase